jgi:hypothetical protein
MDNHFDELTKAMAQPLGRRQALRRLAGLFGAAVVGSLAFGGLAQAGGGGVQCGRVLCKPGEVCCDPAFSVCAKKREACF